MAHRRNLSHSRFEMAAVAIATVCAFGSRQSPPDRALVTTLTNHVDSGAVIPVIDNVYPWPRSLLPAAPPRSAAFGNQDLLIA